MAATHTMIQIAMSEIDQDDLIEYVKMNFEPEDVFGQAEMDEWFESEAKRKDYIPDPGE